MKDEELIQTGLDALDKFMEGFNSRDSERWVESLNFPHTRTAPGVTSSIIHNSQDYITGFDYQRIIATGWEFSSWDYKQIVHISNSKIHAAGQWSRFNNSGETILTTPITYVVTCDEGKWGIQSRFAVDSISDDDMEEIERPAFKIIEAFTQCYNSNNMRGCATLLHYPHLDIRVGQIERLERADDFALRHQGHLQIDSLMAIQSGKKAVNLAVEATMTDALGHSRQYQGIIQVTHKIDHPGISAWSMIQREENSPRSG